MDAKKFFELNKEGGGESKEKNKENKQPEDDLTLHEKLNEFDKRLDNLGKNKNEDNAENPETNN